jgi:hypothetical protein
LNNRALFLAIAASCMLAACDDDPRIPREGNDAYTVQSADQRFEAAVRRINIDGSLLVSQPYQVLVRSLSSESGQQMAVLEADKTDGLHIRWLQSNQLEVCYADAKIRNFTNSFVSVDRTQSKIEEIEVVLKRRESLPECSSSE